MLPMLAVLIELAVLAVLAHLVKVRHQLRQALTTPD